MKELSRASCAKALDSICCRWLMNWRPIFSLGSFGVYCPLQAAKVAAGMLQGTFVRALLRNRRVRIAGLSSNGWPVDWLRGKLTLGLHAKSLPRSWISMRKSRASPAEGMWRGQRHDHRAAADSHHTKPHGTFLPGWICANLYDASFSPWARHCFTWICRRQQMKADKWHAKLIMVKNTAYAWRQMIFFLSLLPPGQLAEFVNWADEHLGKQGESYRERFTPALRGLQLAAAGKFTNSAKVWPGYLKGTHWLLAKS